MIAGGGVLFLILLVLFVFGIVIFCFVVQKGRGSAELNKGNLLLFLTNFTKLANFYDHNYVSTKFSIFSYIYKISNRFLNNNVMFNIMNRICCHCQKVKKKLHFLT